MTLEEAIEYFNMSAELNKGTLVGEENEQVENWLKELKAYKEMIAQGGLIYSEDIN